MKRTFNLIIFAILATLVISSCTSDTTYAKLLDDESALISSFIKRNNIKVVSSFPAKDKWVDDGRDIYVLTTSGLYFHLINGGDTTSTDTLEQYDKVIPRYLQYTLEATADTISNWSTIDFPEPSYFSYLDYTESCTAFHEAASYMMRNETEAKIIVPSKISFSTYLNSVTPLGFHIKMKIQKTY